MANLMVDVLLLQPPSRVVCTGYQDSAHYFLLRPGFAGCQSLGFGLGWVVFKCITYHHCVFAGGCSHEHNFGISGRHLCDKARGHGNLERLRDFISEKDRHKSCKLSTVIDEGMLCKRRIGCHP